MRFLSCALWVLGTLKSAVNQCVGGQRITLLFFLSEILDDEIQVLSTSTEDMTRTVLSTQLSLPVPQHLPPTPSNLPP